ncbi:hypothetical protein Poli38472_007327 [Pythium oligandrum]|uniref:Uncharacterized protein n=1 Tax=Pythium oligandrum TaxID=41045 RepID=A0A8K1C9R6_PYTOL|nr:hypothetical protein Poli38472_007327 [Pythium oligandrum]|eukprot:TMW59182.1 hypothetical protein Poli38472_007327 [Pythium oligandrum]
MTTMLMRWAVLVLCVCFNGGFRVGDALFNAKDSTLGLDMDRIADGPVGWRAWDRFAGFRFEMPHVLDKNELLGAMQRTADVARGLKCFGWIQAVDGDRLVGEARCPKTQATAMLEHLKATCTDDDAFHVKMYTNSKILYHFPTFRVLTEPRYEGKTCFASPPHACEVRETEMYESFARDEL